jgi:hypothetical protein
MPICEMWCGPQHRKRLGDLLSLAPGVTSNVSLPCHLTSVLGGFGVSQMANLSVHSFVPNDLHRITRHGVEKKKWSSFASLYKLQISHKNPELW